MDSAGTTELFPQSNRSTASTSRIDGLGDSVHPGGRCKWDKYVEQLDRCRQRPVILHDGIPIRESGNIICRLLTNSRKSVRQGELVMKRSTAHKVLHCQLRVKPVRYRFCRKSNLASGQNDNHLQSLCWIASMMTTCSQAALFNSGRQFCGGSLIDSTHILTAAHCVAHMSSWDVSRVTVRLGDHNIKTNSEVRHIEKKVKRVVRHRGFDSRTLYNDLAILTMDSAVSFTKQIHPICLPSGKALYNGQTATVIGWGSLRESGPQPAVLQEVSIPVWTNSECKAKYGNAAPGGIVEHFLCAGQAGRDSCSGDSGGPLMINTGQWTQVGIVSWGIGCGKGQYPGVYTRVTHFMPWINKNLK